jgi:hypothetical protein
VARYKVPLQRAYEPAKKRYGAIKILKDGRVRFLEEKLRDGVEFVPQRYYIYNKEKFAIYDSSNYSINVRCYGDHIFGFVVTDNRVAHGSFGGHRSGPALERAVTLMVEAGFGSWVLGGLYEATQAAGANPNMTLKQFYSVLKLLYRVNLLQGTGPITPQRWRAAQAKWHSNSRRPATSRRKRRR